jgi:sphingosine kinase
LEMNVIMTERACHAYDIVHSEIKPGDYDGIVTVSGDGLIHEVVNALYRRQDQIQMMAGTSLGFIPGGSANGLISAIQDYSQEDTSVASAAFIVAKGRTTRMDLTEIDAEYQKEKIYSFLAIFWGILADCDLNSEVLRCLGSMRFTMWGVYRVICKREYAGSLFYTGQEVQGKKDVEMIDEQQFSAELPEMHEECVRHEEDPTQYRDANF